MLELLIIVLALLCDQASKIWAANTLMAAPGQTLPIWQDVFHFSYYENRGAAFGILQGKQLFFSVLTVIALVVIVYILLRYRKQMGTWLRVAFALMLSGAVGNFIDRIMLGYVRDFIDVRLIHFPVFNVADMCLTISVIMLAIHIFFFWKEEPQDKPQGNADTAKGGDTTK